jgi:hypothetical protein
MLERLLVKHPVGLILVEGVLVLALHRLDWCPCLLASSLPFILV